MVFIFFYDSTVLGMYGVFFGEKQFLTNLQTFYIKSLLFVSCYEYDIFFVIYIAPTANCLFQSHIYIHTYIYMQRTGIHHGVSLHASATEK